MKQRRKCRFRSTGLCQGIFPLTCPFAKVELVDFLLETATKNQALLIKEGDSLATIIFDHGQYLFICHECDFATILVGLVERKRNCSIPSSVALFAKMAILRFAIKSSITGRHFFSRPPSLDRSVCRTGSTVCLPADLSRSAGLWCTRFPRGRSGRDRISNHEDLLSKIPNLRRLHFPALKLTRH